MVSDDTPGLKWRSRETGPAVPYWVANAKAVRAGYPIKTVNLTGCDGGQLAERCQRLEAEMLAWTTKPRAQEYDGTLGALLDIYQSHEDSPYQQLKGSSRKPYDVYLRLIREEHGSARLDRLTGLDLKRWHKAWRAPKVEGEGERLGAAAMCLAVFKAAVSFGFVSGFPHCDRLREVGKDLRLPSPAPRDQAPTAADVDAARAAAHALGHHRAALAYALQFEAIARQWDITGAWVEMSDPRPSTTFDCGRKWVGPTWAAIDSNTILTIRPSKTEKTTRAVVHVNLTHCPAVMEELARIPDADRRGPLIVSPATGLPYQHNAWRVLWREVRAKAGLPEGLWNRDLRAGGNTEAEIAGASADDRAKTAGHSKKVNQTVYSRDRLAASDRVVEARERFRRSKS